MARSTVPRGAIRARDDIIVMFAAPATMATTAPRAPRARGTSSSMSARTARIAARALPFRSDKSEINRLKYVIETLETQARELAREAREATATRDDAVGSLDMYKRRLKEAEKDVFKLEKALEEKTAAFEMGMAQARRQIKFTEDKMREATRERDDAVRERDEATRRLGASRVDG